MNEWKERRLKMFEHITANEIAGYTVGALLLSATISAPRVDFFVSSSQRSSLGMCKRCGDLKVISCTKCKGSGLIKEGGAFSFLEEKKRGSALKSNHVSSCMNCRARGCFPCPECAV